MRQLTMEMTALVSPTTKVQANEGYVTSIIDNKGDKLFSTICPNPAKEPIILLHGGAGVVFL